MAVNKEKEFHKDQISWNKGMKMPPKLTGAQKLFVLEYLVDMDATKAYQRTGFRSKTPKADAHKLMQRPLVKQAVLEAINRRNGRIEVTQDMVVQEYAKLAFLDPRQFYDKDGNVLPITEIPAEIAAAISSIETATMAAGKDKPAITTAKIKFIDKKSALDSLARHLGMFIDKTEVEHSGGVVVEIKRFGLEAPTMKVIENEPD